MSANHQQSAEPDPAPTTWPSAPFVSEDRLTGTFWRFTTDYGLVLSNFLVLAPDGLIGNFYSKNEDSWKVDDGRLVFTSSNGIPTTIFDRGGSPGQVTHLAGRVLIGADTHMHVLHRVEHPPHPTFATPADMPRQAEFVRRLRRPQRPNLVVLRAGPESLHESWTRDITDQQRNWDLCVSYYGKNLEDFTGDAEYLSHQPSQRKFQALFDLFHPGSPLWAYDRIWFPDDDLMTGWRDINRIFHLSLKHGLDLCQPSLRPGPDCYATHDMTYQRPGSLLRYVHFIEIMCPLFSPRALRICLGTFRDSVSGFGLDQLWPSLLGGSRNRMAILDDVALVHTRPVGLHYDLRAAAGEEAALLSAYPLRRIVFPPATVETGT